MRLKGKTAKISKTVKEGKNIQAHNERNKSKDNGERRETQKVLVQGQAMQTKQYLTK